MDCPAPPTSLLWPDPTDFPSITSTGYSLSSQRTWRNPAFATEPLQHALFSTYPHSPLWAPSSLTSTSFLLQPSSYSRWWCWLSGPSTELHLSTSKHRSDHLPQCKHFAPEHQLAGWCLQRWEQTKPSKQSHDSSLFWYFCVVGGEHILPPSIVGIGLVNGNMWFIPKLVNIGPGGWQADHLSPGI